MRGEERRVEQKRPPRRRSLQQQEKQRTDLKIGHYEEEDRGGTMGGRSESGRVRSNFLSCLCHELEKSNGRGTASGRIREKLRQTGRNRGGVRRIDCRCSWRGVNRRAERFLSPQ